MKISKLGEFGLIEVLKKSVPVSKAVIKGIGDDAAVLPYSKTEYLLLTTDMLAEDSHFTRRMSPQSIGHKALACNISDIAAMRRSTVDRFGQRLRARQIYIHNDDLRACLGKSSDAGFTDTTGSSGYQRDLAV